MLTIRMFTFVSKSIIRTTNHVNLKLISPLSIYVVNTDLSAKHCETEPNLCRGTAPHLQICRHYAKGKDKKREKHKGKVLINESLLAEVVNVESLKSHMQKAVDHMKEDFIKHLSLRSTTGSIESISVSLDGKEHTLQELAQIVRKNPKTIVMNMAVFPQAIPNVLQALTKSGMNLSPQQDGTNLYIPIPKVTKEHRESLAKNAKQLFVKCKDAIRDVQTKNVKQMKRKDSISEDLIRNVETQIIAIADSYIDEAQTILDSKQKELLGTN